MSVLVPSVKARPRFVDPTGSVLDLVLINKIRQEAVLPNDALIHDMLTHREQHVLTQSALKRLYNFEHDASLPWLALILDHVALGAYEIAQQPRPTSIVKYRPIKRKARNDKDKLLNDIRRLRTSMHLNCSMEDETRAVSSLHSGSTAGKVDLELIRLEYEIDAKGKAIDISSGDVMIELPPSLRLLCRSILTEYERASGNKARLIKTTQLYQFDIDAILDFKSVKYSSVRHLHNGLQRLFVALSEDGERINDIRDAVMSIDEYGQMFVNAIYELRLLVDRRSATRSNKELSDLLVSLRKDISMVRVRLSETPDLSEPPTKLISLLDTLCQETIDVDARIHRRPMRTGREPDNIRLQHLITELRIWYLRLSDDTRRYTIVTPDQDAGIENTITIGPFFELIRKMSEYLGLKFEDNTLRKNISLVLHELEGTPSNHIFK